ncbi:MAG TPA: hypothetical protein ENG39_00590, partial [Candidatus Omnitrophica bacterium]|nr:hypothetical protein [Candidatus Omnitrophota bacterium]
MSKKKKTRNLSKEINKKILKIWHDHSKFITKNFGNYAPLLYPKLQRRPDILFVGLNPSLNEEWLKKQYFGEEILQKIKIRWKEGLSSKDLVDLVKIEEIARRGVAKEEPYPYYKKFDEVCEDIGSWESIDLFLVRKTKQIQFKRNIEKFLLCEKQ